MGRRLFLIVSLISHLAIAQETGVSDEAQDELTEPAAIALRRANSLWETIGVPGLSVAVSQNAQLVWSAYLGQASIEHNIPVSAETRMKLGSVAKVVTASAAASLFQDGRLNIDTPISAYVENLPPSHQQITTRQLLGHLSGIRHYAGDDFSDGANIDLQHFASVSEALSIFINDPLEFSPGEQYGYSTFGYTLVGVVISSVSGLPLFDTIKREVLDPLGMTKTVVDDPHSIIPHRTDYFEVDTDGRIRHADWVDPSYKIAGGGLLSTVEDMVKFGEAHLSGGFLFEETLAMIFTPLRTSDGQETGVGIGWRIDRGIHGETIFHHEGSQSGGRSALLIYPDSDLVVALLTNASGLPMAVYESAQLLADPFLSIREDYRESNTPASLSGTVVLANPARDFQEEQDISKFRAAEVFSNGSGRRLIVVEPRLGLISVDMSRGADSRWRGMVDIYGGLQVSFDLDPGTLR